MIKKLLCPHCKRCLGVFQSTDEKNSICKVYDEPLETTKLKEHVFHCSCRRCKKEIYVLMGFTD